MDCDGNGQWFNFFVCLDSRKALSLLEIKQTKREIEKKEFAMLAMLALSNHSILAECLFCLLLKHKWFLSIYSIHTFISKQLNDYLRTNDNEFSTPYWLFSNRFGRIKLKKYIHIHTHTIDTYK